MKTGNILVLVLKGSARFSLFYENKYFSGLPFRVIIVWTSTFRLKVTILSGYIYVLIGFDGKHGS